MNEAIKPCPKCNGQATLVEGSYDYYGGGRYYAFSAELVCVECGLSFKVDNGYPKMFVPIGAMWDFAIEAWNTRYERTCEVVYDEHGCPKCGECGCVLYSTSGYCPNCGVRLTEREEEDE